jgi:hypothetical protein
MLTDDDFVLADLGIAINCPKCGNVSLFVRLQRI